MAAPDDQVRGVGDGVVARQGVDFDQGGHHVLDDDLGQLEDLADDAVFVGVDRRRVPVEELDDDSR